MSSLAQSYAKFLFQSLFPYVFLLGRHISWIYLWEDAQLSVYCVVTQPEAPSAGLQWNFVFPRTIPVYALNDP